MNCAEYAPLIDALVDGSLPESQRAALDSHLATCLPCRAEVDGLRKVLAATVELPRGREPSRDLWPAISQAIGSGAKGPTRGRLDPAAASVSPWLRPWPLAAAALLLVSLASGVTMLVMSPGRTALEAPAPSGPALPASYRDVEADFVRAARDLSRTLDAMKDQIPPDARTRLTTLVGLIDDAIAESRDALVKDPGNTQLPTLLWTAHRRKIDLLEQATRLASWS